MKRILFKHDQVFLSIFACKDCEHCLGVRFNKLDIEYVDCMVDPFIAATGLRIENNYVVPPNGCIDAELKTYLLLTGGRGCTETDGERFY